MSSTLKFLATPSSISYESKWRNQLKAYKYDFIEYVKTLSVADQLRFLLDQTLGLSYFFYIYGAYSHDMFTSYSKDISAFIDYFEKVNTVDGVDEDILKTIKTIKSSWYSMGGWTDVSIKLIKTYLFDLNPELLKNENAPTPRVFTPTSLVPYLMHRNKLIKDGYISCGQSALYSVGFANMLFYNAEVDGRVLYGQFNSAIFGTNFYADIEDVPGIDKPSIDAYNNTFVRSGLTFLSMIAKMTLASKSFESIMGTFGQMCLYRDTSATVSANQQLFYVTDTILTQMYRLDFIEVNRSSSNPIEGQSANYMFRSDAILHLLRMLNVTQGVRFHNKEMFIRFFGNRLTDKDKDSTIHKIVEYVKESGDSVASAESKEAFMASPLGSCEAIDLISQRIPVRAQEQGSDKTEEEPDDTDQDDRLDLSDLPEREDAEPGLEADDVSPEEEDTSTDDDEGEDDSSSQGSDDKGKKDNKEETSEDDKSSQKDEASNDDTDSGTASVGSDTAAASTANDTQVGSNAPEDIDASDSLNDVPFKISPEGSETVDSVVLREELDKFVSEILVNPPKKLSPQTIRALTDLQKYWIHILSVETITGILGALVALPEKFKTIINTHGEEIHE